MGAMFLMTASEADLHGAARGGRREQTMKYMHNPCAECDPSDTCRNCAFGSLTAATSGIPIDRLEAICVAEREGRCAVLPCKEGAPIYRLIEDWKCNSDCWGRDTCPDCTAECKKTCTEIREGRFSVMYDSGDFGKTVFLTRAEAEAAKGGDGE
jgi:glycerol kinase